LSVSKSLIQGNTLYHTQGIPPPFKRPYTPSSQQDLTPLSTQKALHPLLSTRPYTSLRSTRPYTPLRSKDLPPLLSIVNMATWFSVVARIASTEGITNSIYQNAWCEFPEGPRGTDAESEESSWRGIFVSFYGDLLQAGKNYIIFGSARLPANTDTDMPLVSDALLKLWGLTSFCNFGSLTVIYSSLPTTLSLIYPTTFLSINFAFTLLLNF